MDNPEDTIRTYLELQIAGGFRDPDEIAEAALEYDEEIEPDVARPIIERLLPQLIAARLGEQKHWPTTTDCDRLDAAFAELTASGIVCRQDFTCCQNCGVAEIGAEIEDEAASGVAPRGYAFYHQQDTEGAVEGHGVHLSFGALNDEAGNALAIGTEIAAVLTRHGLVCIWDGTTARRIQVDLNWQRRLAVTSH